MEYLKEFTDPLRYIFRYIDNLLELEPLGLIPKDYVYEAFSPHKIKLLMDEILIRFKNSCSNNFYYGKNLFSGINAANLTSPGYSIDITQIERIGNSIKGCKNKINVILLILPKHLNVLIYRKDQNTFEHFEPHGSDILGADYSTYDVEKFIKTFILSLNLKKYIPDGYRILPSNATCPIVISPSIKPVEELGIGFQTFESMDRPKIASDGGFCSQWTLFYIELVLMYPDVDTFYIYNKVLKYLNKVGPNGFYRFIRAYSYKNFLYLDFKTSNQFFYTHDIISSSLHSYSLNPKVAKYLKIVDYAKLVKSLYGPVEESYFRGSRAKLPLIDSSTEESTEESTKASSVDVEFSRTFGISSETLNVCYDLSKMKSQSILDYIREDKNQNIIISLNDKILCWKRKYFINFLNQDKRNIIYISSVYDESKKESEIYYRIYEDIVISKEDLRDIVQVSRKCYFFNFIEEFEFEESFFEALALEYKPSKFYSVISYTLKDYEMVL